MFSNAKFKVFVVLKLAWYAIRIRIVRDRDRLTHTGTFAGARSGHKLKTALRPTSR